MEITKCSINILKMEKEGIYFVRYTYLIDLASHKPDESKAHAFGFLKPQLFPSLGHHHFPQLS